MANYSTSDLNIVGATRDAVDDSTVFQAQSTAPFTIQIANLLIRLTNASAAAMGIISATESGFLTGRRPVTGQLFPRGVYNK